MKGYFSTNPFSDMTLSEDDSTHYSSSSISPTEEDGVLSFASSQSSYYMVPTTMQDHHFINEYNYFPQQQGYSSGSDSHSLLMYPSSPTEGHPFMNTQQQHPFHTTTPSPTSSLSSKSLTNFTGSNGSAANAMYLRPTTTTTTNTQECIVGSFSDLGFSHHHQQQDSSNSNSDFDNERKTKTTTSSHGLTNNDHTRSSTSTIENYKTDYKPKKSSCNAKSDGGGSTREKSKKRCSNCHSIHSPSWRRSISKYTKGALLCNACGLYEKTAKKKRMLVTQEDGNTKVVRKRDGRDYCCSVCGVKDATRWRRSYDSVKCERCARNERSSTAAHRA